MTEFKVLMNDKAALFEEMYSNALILLNRDKQIILNEEEIIQLKHEIDINILEIEQKTFIISELQTKLAEKKATYKALKADIKELEDQCEELEAILKQKDEEIDTLEDILREKEVTILGLERILGEKRPVLTDADRAKKEMPSKYKAVLGDEVDELLAKYINSMEINVPIRRLEPGFYLFGTRKIYAKVLNQKLVVRVGGGYMSFTEFIDAHALPELKKINELQAQGNWDLDTYIRQMVESNQPEFARGKSNLLIT